MALFHALLPLVVVAGLLTLAERLVARGSSDWWRNLQAWALQLLAALFVLPLLAPLQAHTLLDAGDLPFWLGFTLFLLVRDFAEFAYHRAQHAVPALWALHSLHHSDPDMSALTTQRHHWADQLVKACTVWPLSILLVGPTPEILGVYATVSLWHFFVHSRLPVSFGKWSWLLNHPAYHRRHHSSLPEHYNSNFASLFPVFDVLCGSYHRPDGFPPTGLDRKPESLAELTVWPLTSSPSPSGEGLGWGLSSKHGVRKTGPTPQSPPLKGRGS